MERAYRLSIAVLWVLLLHGPGTVLGCPPKALTVGELTNPFLGPEYASWMIGPISCLATDQEISAFIRLENDAAAKSFIEEFWHRHQGVRGVFEERALEADKRYSEAALAGRRSDRGTIYVIYGPPEEVLFEDFRDVDEPAIEQWKYPKKAEPGLDGKRPNRSYRFAKQGELTKLYRPRAVDERRRRLDSRPRVGRRPGAYDPPL